VLSGLFELRHAGEGNLPVGATALATLLAFVTGYASIALLLRYLAHHTIAVFVGYRVVLGVVVIALAAAGAIN
jgi:undecaprenyl-diphosphatase